MLLLISICCSCELELYAVIIYYIIHVLHVKYWGGGGGVSQHPACMDDAILHGKPFGIPLLVDTYNLYMIVKFSSLTGFFKKFLDSLQGHGGMSTLLSYGCISPYAV